ncbi:MAG TPA: hypothetical protein VGK19_14670 [Capsulimonadaceae bacterium]|jgi:uncharacterized protein YgbK (DUF1537 family)
MLILMNVIAFLLILALLGLIATLILLVTTAKQYVSTGQKAVTMVEPTQNAGIELVNGIRGRAIIIANRAVRIGKHVQSAATAVSECVTVVGTLATETAEQVSNAKAEAARFAENIGDPEDAFRLFQNFASTLHKAKR